MSDQEKLLELQQKYIELSDKYMKASDKIVELQTIPYQKQCIDCDRSFNGTYKLGNLFCQSCSDRTGLNHFFIPKQ